MVSSGISPSSCSVHSDVSHTLSFFARAADYDGSATTLFAVGLYFIIDNCNRDALRAGSLAHALSIGFGVPDIAGLGQLSLSLGDGR
jgi:hypothetical protein